MMCWSCSCSEMLFTLMRLHSWQWQSRLCQPLPVWCFGNLAPLRGNAKCPMQGPQRQHPTLPHAIQLDMEGTSAWLPWKSLSLKSNKWAENRKKKSELCLLKCPRPLLPHHPVKTSSSCMIQGSFTSFVFPGLYQLSQPLQPSSVAGLNESQLISAWFTWTHQLQLPATRIWLQIKSRKKENTGFPYRNCTQLLQN